MKRTKLLVVALALNSVRAAAQPAVPALELDPQVIDRGPHHRSWQRVIQVTWPQGGVFLQTNSYVQLQNGAHYQNANGQWVESEETIEIVNGVGIANKGLHRATFPANIRTAGGIELMTPDGKRLRSHIMGLAYTDARTGQSVLIADPKDSIGEVTGNEVIYPDALTDFIADVRYTYKRSGLEQDIIFLENPPSPAQYGLDPETTRLEVFTEFLEAPVPESRSSVLVEENDPLRRQAMFEPDLTDEYLSFGIMAIGAGKAFPATSALNEDNSVPVGKAWTVINQRTFLIEKVDYRSVRAELQRLPAAAGVKPRNDRVKREVMLAQLGRVERAAPVTRGLELAAVGRPAKGFVLDYEIITTATNVTLRADTTYLVTNNFTLSGTTVLESCVVKYTTNTGTGPKLVFTGPIDCQTGLGRPAFFVSKDDDTVGEIITGSTGAPIGNFGFRALELSYSGNTIELHNIHVRNASRGIVVINGTKLLLKNAQFGFTFRCIENNTHNSWIQNALFYNSFYGVASGHTSHVEHATFHNLSLGYWLSGNANTVRLTNSIIVGVTTYVPFTGSNVVTNQSDSGFFQSVGAGHHYLAIGSTNRNVGTAVISASLLADLKKRTTYPPVLLTNDITTTTTLSPQVERDTSAPDLGYHYDPLDYTVNEIDVSATLTIQPGTAVGVYGASGSYGLQLLQGGSLVCEGTVTDPCRFVRYNLVQEQTNSTWAASSCGYTFRTPDNLIGNTPSARFRFTEFSMPAAGTEHFWVGFYDGPAVGFHDCIFGSGRFMADKAGATFTNCLFDRVEATFAGIAGNFQNNLFYGGSTVFAPFALDAYNVKNSLFDRAAVSQPYGSIVHDYNGYVTNSAGQWLTNSGGHDVFTNAFAYESGALGRFYQPTNSPFLNIGSTNANLLGLYHYTVQNVKETNSIVDMGFHRVAVDGNGLPVDSDSDGIPDYIEDTDGDGLTDIGEFSFANPVLTLTSPVDYIRGSPPKRLNTNAIAFDEDSPNFGGGQLKVSIVVYANSNDRLGIRDEGTNATQISVSTNGIITYGATTIGTLTGGTGTGPLVVTFNNNASNAAVQALVRNLTFQNVSSNTPISSRIVEYVLTDGHGGTNSPTFQTINVICPETVDAMLVIDISASMTPSDFLQAQQAASNFVSYLDLSFDRVGLVSFAGDAYLNSPLTNNGPAIQSMIMGLTITNGTRFHPPFDLARSNLTQTAPNVLPLIILLSDGQSGTATGMGTDDEKATNRILATNACLAVKDAGIRIISLAYGTVTGINGGTNLMRWFASSANDYHYAPSASEIQSEYDVIAQGLCRPPSPPSITIVSPRNGAMLSSPATFRIETNPTDVDGIITKVEFFNGSISLGIVTNPPFHYIINNALAGSYTFKAIATDDDNVSSSPAQVVISVVNCSNVGLYSLTLDQADFAGGLSTTGRVTITAPAPAGGQAVTLTCGSPNVSIPPSILISAGQTNASFRVDTWSSAVDTDTSIRASLYGATLFANLEIRATNAHGAGRFYGECGPMDVAFVVCYGSTLAETTFGGLVTTARTNIWITLSNAVDLIDFASGRDYRLALVGVTNAYHVATGFAMTNRQAFLTSLTNVWDHDTWNYEPSYDEALNMVINSLPATNRPKQFGDFTNGFRAHARKIIILLADKPPVNFTNYYYRGIDDVNTHWRAVEAWAKGIQISASTWSWDESSSETVRILEDLALTTGGMYAWAGDFANQLTNVIPPILSQCGVDVGEVVFVRDDNRQLAYAGLTLDDSAKEGSASDFAAFNAEAIDGDVVGVRVRRSGQLRLNYGSHFDLQLGVASIIESNIASYGILAPNAHTNGVGALYDWEWDLPFSFYPDLAQQFGTECLLSLRDRVSAPCGNNFEIIDFPGANFPAYRNTLTFKVLRRREIPQGRCRDLVLTGAGLPVLHTWSISLRGQVIASSGIPNDWNVEPDYTAYGGFNICVPRAAIIGREYEVRYRDAQGVGHSGPFEVVAADKLQSAPVLKPLHVSVPVVTTNSAVTVTVALDAPAPSGGAVISLNSTGLSNAIPSYVVIPSGETQTPFNIRIFGSITSNVLHEISASYNGMRKAYFTVVNEQGSAPSAPTNLTVQGQAGAVQLTWNLVTNALFYRIERTNRCDNIFNPVEYMVIAEKVFGNWYLDQQVTPGMTNCYVVVAVNSYGEAETACNSDSTAGPLTCAQATASGTSLLRPIISPPGGRFYDTVPITISNVTPGAMVYYTTNGVSPTTNDILYIGPFVLTNSAIVIAKAFIGGSGSEDAQRDFLINNPRPFSCGSNAVLSLAWTNWPSVARQGIGNCERFTFSGQRGQRVTIKVSADFDPYVALWDPARQIVAQTRNPIAYYGELEHVCRTNGEYVIEVATWGTLSGGGASPIQNIPVSLSLECENVPKLQVVVDGGSVTNEATVDMGITPVNTVLSKTITITNWGALNLQVSNLIVYGTPLFSVSPATLDPIPPGGFTNLTVSFNSGVTGLFTGALHFFDNDVESDDDVWPFVINLMARANPAGVPPRVVITSPTEAQLFTTPANVTIAATATATNTTTISQVDFYVINKSGTSLVGSDTTSPYSVVWGNTAGGNYTLRAVAIDAVGRVSLPTNVNVSFNNPPVLSKDFFGLTRSFSNELEVLINDKDSDGDSLSITAVGTPTNGTAILTGGKLIYDPVPTAIGRDFFTYTVSDGRGGTATTNISIVILPDWFPENFNQTATLTFPTNNTQISSPLQVTGSALSPYLSFYWLQYRPRGGIPKPWKTFVEGDIEINNGILGTFDPTGLPNGAYEIKLRVTDWNDGATVETQPVVVYVGEGMKVGHFTVSFNDLQIPVSGLPITLTRTYDSRNTTSGEFGAGWRLDIGSARLEKTGILGSGWGLESRGLGSLYSCIQPTEPHIVTITFPNDQKFQFNAELDLNNSGQSCTLANGLSAAQARIVFRPLPGTTGTLAPLHHPSTLDINVFDVDDITLHEDRGDISILGPIYDPTEFVFITLDGRQFQFNAEGKVVKMTDRSGNTLTFGDDGIIHSSGKSVRFVRDPAGRITDIYDPNGLNESGQPTGLPVLTYTYDGLGNLSHVARLTDRGTTNYLTTTFLYDNARYPNYLTAIEDPRGVTGIRNEYDENGRLKTSTDASGKSITFVHDINGRTETIVDRLGNTNIFIYDAKGNITSSVNALGQTNLFTYDSNNNKTSETNPNGETIGYSFDENNLLRSISNAAGIVTYTYNNYGQITQIADPLSHATVNKYDNRGNLTNTVDALQEVTRFLYDTNGNTTAQTDALGNIVTNRYDAFGNLTNAATLNAQLTVLSSTSYSYDANGNRTNETMARTLPGGETETLVTKFIYDAQDRLTHTIEPDGKTNTVVYDENGKPKQNADKLGQITRSHYDDRGHLWRTTYPDLTVEDSGYDAEGRRTFSTNRLGNVTQYVYDALGRLIQTIFPDNTTNTTVYDLAGRVAHTIDARGKTNAFGYDAAGRRTSVTNAWGTAVQQVMTYAYNAAGSLTNMVDALGRGTDYEYDALNRRVKTIFPATVSGGIRTNILTAYDGLGRRIAETNESRVINRFGYDGLGRLIAATNAWNTADVTWATYAYDEAGNQTNQVDALNRKTKYEYDALGRRTKRILPGDQVETFGYDQVGNLVAHTNFNGLVITNQCDSMNRLVKKAAGSTVLETYAYDVAGRLTNRTDAAGTWIWVYDSRDRLKTNTGPVGSLYYRYDAVGNLTNLVSSTSSGTSVDYQYDVLNRLTNVLDQRLTGTKNTAYAYDSVGNLAGLKYPNGITNLWEYDARNRLTNALSKLNTTTLASFFYQLGVAGNRTNLSETFTSVNRSYAWAYDQSYRLTNETLTGTTPTGIVGYRYDAVGNRTNRSSTLSGITNHTPSYTTNDWLTWDTYDNNGNTTDAGSIGYQYDYANRLTNANNGGVVIVYDADGNRVSKNAAGTTTIYLVDTRNLTGYAQVLEELTVSGSTNLAKAYTYGLDLISQRHVNTSTNFFGYDGLGSTRVLTDGVGNTVNVFAYDAYGTLIASNTTAQTAYLYTGEQFDSDLGLYHLRARYLKPDTGRFWTRDSFEGNRKNPLSLHKYLYAHGDPSNHIDPSGHTIIPFPGSSRVPRWIGPWVTKVAQTAGPAVAFAMYLGYSAHKAILRDYRLLYGANESGVFLNQNISSILNVNTAGLDPETKADLRLRPDIVNTTSKELWEIKSGQVSYYLGLADALKDMWDYLKILNDPAFKLPGPGFRPGSSYDPIVISLSPWWPAGFIFVDADIDGTLVYYLDNGSNSLIAAIAGLSLANTLRNVSASSAANIIRIQFEGRGTGTGGIGVGVASGF